MNKISHPSAPQVPCATKLAHGLALLKRGADINGAETYDDINREQGMYAPGGAPTRHGWWGGMTNYLGGALGAAGSGIGWELGGIGRGIGNVLDYTGATSGAGDAMKAFQAPYQNAFLRSVHAMQNQRTSNALDDYMHGTVADQIVKARREGGVMRGIANASAFGNDAREYAQDLIPVTVAAPGMVGGIGKVLGAGGEALGWGGRIAAMAGRASQLGKLSPFAGRVGSVLAGDAAAMGNTGARVAGAANAALGESSPLWSKLAPSAAQHAFNSWPVGLAEYGAAAVDNSKEWQHYWGLDQSPEGQVVSRLPLEQQKELNARAVAYTNTAMANRPEADIEEEYEKQLKQLKTQVMQNSYHATPLDRVPLKFNADSGVDFNNPEAGELAKLGDTLADRYRQYLVPKLHQQILSGQQTPAVQKGLANYTDAVRHNVVNANRELSEDGSATPEIDPAYIQKYLPEEHRAGFQGWLNGTGTITPELRHAVQDLHMHYNIGNKLGWNKLEAPPTAPVDTKNLWAPPAPATPTLPMTTPSSAIAAIKAAAAFDAWFYKVAIWDMPKVPPVGPGGPGEEPVAAPVSPLHPDGINATPVAGPPQPEIPFETDLPADQAAPPGAVPPQAPAKPGELPQPEAASPAPPQTPLPKVGPGGVNVTPFLEEPPPGGGQPTTPDAGNPPGAGSPQPGATAPGGANTPGTANAVAGKAGAPPAAPVGAKPAAPAAKPAAPAPMEDFHSKILPPEQFEQMRHQISTPEFEQLAQTNPEQAKSTLDKFWTAAIAQKAAQSEKELGTGFNPAQWAGQKMSEIHSHNFSPTTWKDIHAEACKDAGVNPQDPTMFQQIGAHLSGLIDRAVKGDTDAQLKLAGYAFGVCGIAAGLYNMVTNGVGVASVAPLVAGTLGIAGGAGAFDSLGSMLGGSPGTQPGGSGQVGNPTGAAIYNPHMDNDNPNNPPPLPASPLDSPGKPPAAASGAPAPQTPPGTPPGAPAAPGGNPALAMMRNPNASSKDIESAGQQLMHDPAALQSMPPNSPETIQFVQRYASVNPEFKAGLVKLKSSMGGLLGGLVTPQRIVDATKDPATGQPTMSPEQAEWLMKVAPNVQI